MNTYELMELNKNSFTNNEELIYEFIKDNAYEVFRGTIVDMANKVGVSQPAITRFCKKIGYESFTDFKMNLYKAEKESGETKSSDMNFPVLESYTSLIKKMDTVLDKHELKEFAHSIINARRVFIVGTHKSRLPAELFQLNVYKFGINCNLFTSETDVELNMLTNSDDLVIIVSAFGELYKNLVKELNNNDVPIALLTMNNKITNKQIYKHLFWLPNHRNQNEDVYTENPVIFSMFIDLLTSFIAKSIRHN